LTQLSDAYTFLRQLEHILQMENGLQTHLIPNDDSRRAIVAAKMRCAGLAGFDDAVAGNMSRVNAIYHRVFDSISAGEADSETWAENVGSADERSTDDPIAFSRDERSDTTSEIESLAAESQRLADLVRSKPFLTGEFPGFAAEFPVRDYRNELLNATADCPDFSSKLAALRNTWSRFIFEIIVYDLSDRISLKRSKSLQTELAEASIATALAITTSEINRKYGTGIETLPLAVLGLGKIVGSGVDYDSDLDLVMVCGDNQQIELPAALSLL
jgi:glutamate-ammonia-ligase adenylyltransferase